MVHLVLQGEALPKLLGVPLPIKGARPRKVKPVPLQEVTRNPRVKKNPKPTKNQKALKNPKALKTPKVLKHPKLTTKPKVELEEVEHPKLPQVPKVPERVVVRVAMLGCEPQLESQTPGQIYKQRLSRYSTWTYDLLQRPRSFSSTSA